MRSYVIYARKSSESEDRQALSIEAQTDELKRFANNHGLTIAEIFTESKSAKRSGRPVFSAMLKALRSPDIVGILAWKLDRLSRNLADAALLSEAMDDGLLHEIRTPTQTFKNTSTDRFMSGMEWLVGRKYIDDLSENVKRGMRTKVNQGWYPSQAPLGYLNDRNHPQGRRKIIKDPRRFALVRKLWDLMLTGRYSVPMVQKEAAENLGITTRKGRYPAGRRLSLSGLYRLFTNVFYTGQFEYLGEICQGKHEPMVTLGEFERVQTLIQRRDRPRPKRHQFAFSGLIRCGQCGAAVTAEEKLKQIKSTGQWQRYVYYHCTHRLKIPCQQRSITESELKRQVDEFLSRLTVPREYVDLVFKCLNEFKDREQQTQHQAIKSLESELNSVERRLENLLALRISPENEKGELLSDKEYLKQKTELVRVKGRLKENLTGKADIKEKVVALTKETFEFARNARMWFANGTQEKQRAVLSGIGSNHTLRDKKLLIVAKKPLIVVERHLSTAIEDLSRLEPENPPAKPTKDNADGRLTPQWRALVNDVITEVRRGIT